MASIGYSGKLSVANRGSTAERVKKKKKKITREREREKRRRRRRNREINTERVPEK